MAFTLTPPATPTYAQFPVVPTDPPGQPVQIPVVTAIPAYTSIDPTPQL